MTGPWPEAFAEGAFGATEELLGYIEGKHELVRAGRVLRSDYSLAPSLEVDFVVRTNNALQAEMLNSDMASLRSLLRASNIDIAVAAGAEKAMPSGVSPLGTIYMPLEGVIDVAAELEKLAGQIAKSEGDLARVKGKLSNEKFVSRAPAEVVQVQRDRETEIVEQLAKLQGSIETLKAGQLG